MNQNYYVIIKRVSIIQENTKPLRYFVASPEPIDCNLQIAPPQYVEIYGVPKTMPTLYIYLLFKSLFYSYPEILPLQGLYSQCHGFFSLNSFINLPGFAMQVLSREAYLGILDVMRKILNIFSLVKSLYCTGN